MRPREIFAVTFTLLVLTLVLGACAERKDPADTGIKTHPIDWMDPVSANFHGALVAQNTPQNCTACHGADLQGEDSAPSCYECHEGPSGHPAEYAVPPSPFHGETVAAEGNARCAKCHGEDYRGGWAMEWAEDPNRTSCYYCHGMGPSGHPSGWLTPNSRSFHGAEVRADGPDRCATCHGDDFMGGISGVSCYQCHNGPSGHPEGWRYPPDPFHGSVVIAEGAARCVECHTDDASNWTGWYCSSCH